MEVKNGVGWNNWSVKQFEVRFVYISRCLYLVFIYLYNCFRLLVVIWIGKFCQWFWEFYLASCVSDWNEMMIQNCVYYV